MIQWLADKIVFGLTRLFVKRMPSESWDAHYLEGLSGGYIDLQEHAAHSSAECRFCKWYESYQEDETLKTARRVTERALDLASNPPPPDKEFLQQVYDEPGMLLAEAHQVSPWATPKESAKKFDYGRFATTVRSILHDLVKST